ncbi:hypothetical protein [Bradyrhizobium sp. ISRA442]|uniref:hypothetical protein n=1 Tax=Bradyrhizobium sp. ISRA442 TaxID=2866197 RepID=UPI00404B6F79
MILMYARLGQRGENAGQSVRRDRRVCGRLSPRLEWLFAAGVLAAVKKFELPAATLQVQFDLTVPRSIFVRADELKARQCLSDRTFCRCPRKVLRVRRPALTGSAYPIIYLTTIGDVVHVRHAFRKKPQAKAKRDVDLAKARLRPAQKLPAAVSLIASGSTGWMTESITPFWHTAAGAVCTG